MKPTVVILEKRYLWHDGTPASDWEPSTFCPDWDYAVAFAKKGPFSSRMGQPINGTGKAAYTYEMRATRYERIQG